MSDTRISWIRGRDHGDLGAVVGVRNSAARSSFAFMRAAYPSGDARSTFVEGVRLPQHLGFAASHCLRSDSNRSLCEHERGH